MKGSEVFLNQRNNIGNKDPTNSLFFELVDLNHKKINVIN